MRVVVVGGAGFVGLNVCEGLLAAGHDVVAFDRNPVPDAARDEFADWPGAFQAVQGDVTDADALATAVKGADAAVDGAALTSNARTETAQARRVLDVNLMGFLSLLEAARGAGLQRVVNLSSGSAYGAAAYGEAPLREDVDVADPVTLYALTKFASERLGARVGSLWDLDVRSVRLSAVFGPWERGTGARDTLSPPFQVVRAALTGAPAILERHDVRDWLYAPDVAGAVQALLLTEAPGHDLYNVSVGRTWDLYDWANGLRSWFPDLQVRIAAPGEVPTVLTHQPRPRQPLAAERLTQDLGFRAAFGLEESLDHYGPWARAHAALIRGDG
jgi:UDP-glucose 4-epimerase